MDATAIVRVNISLIIVGSSCRKMVGYYKLLYFSWWITTYEKYYKKKAARYHHVCLISPISCWHVTRLSRHSVRLMNAENQNTKRKTEIYVFSGFGHDNSRSWERKSTAGRFATGRFCISWVCAWKISSVGKNKVNNWEFCTLKTTSIVVLVKIRRIFFRLEP